MQELILLNTDYEACKLNKEDIKSGIYCLENSVNGKKYVGQAINLEKRRKEHGHKDRSKGCKALRNALKNMVMINLYIQL